MRSYSLRRAFLSLLLGAAVSLRGAETPGPAPAPTPASPFLGVVYRYGDAMLRSGRDEFGPVKTGLFLGALDRSTLAPLEGRPAAPAGVREEDRDGPPGRLTGANPQRDENLLRVLYTLSELSGKPDYREAADRSLKWFLESAGSPATGLLPWGEHMCWDTLADAPVPGPGSGDPGRHEFARPWVLWDRSFELAPGPSRRFALGLWEHQVADRETGAFDASAGYHHHEAREGMDLPRHAGFFIRTWAAAHRHSKDEVFLRAIETVLARFERKRHPATGLLPAAAGRPDSSPASSLSLAIDCDAAARQVPEPLATRLRAFAAREDELFLALPHEPAGKGGFVASADRETGKPSGLLTPLWEARADGATTAQVALMCVSRYENTGKTGCRELIHGAARAYLGTLAAGDADVWPMTFGHAIALELAAWRSTARPAHLDRARKLGEVAVATFWRGESPLPRASSLRCEHYESITGADTLALALVELHLSILHITAVRAPGGTIDR